MANSKHKKHFGFSIAAILPVLLLCNAFWYASAEIEYLSAVGDPGMRRDSLRVAIESWNQCNEVGEQVPHMGSPRAADCFDIYKASPQSNSKLPFSFFLFVSVKENIFLLFPSTSKLNQNAAEHMID